MKRIAFLLTFLIASPAFAANNVIQSAVSTYCGGGYTAPIKFAVIDDASSGDNTLVSAVTGKKIRVLSYGFVVAGAVTVRFESGAGGTALTGQMQFASAGSGISADCGIYGCFETASGALLNLELSDAVSVDGYLSYAECE